MSRFTHPITEATITYDETEKMETVTLTYTHPVFGTTTKKYDVVQKHDDLVVLSHGDKLGTVTVAEINAMHGVWHTEPHKSLIRKLLSLFI